MLHGIINHGLAPIGDAFVQIPQETGTMPVTGCLAVIAHGMLTSAHTATVIGTSTPHVGTWVSEVTTSVAASAPGGMPNTSTPLEVAVANANISVFDSVFENPPAQYQGIQFARDLEPAREIMFGNMYINAETLMDPELSQRFIDLNHAPHLVLVHQYTQLVGLMHFDPELEIQDMVTLTPCDILLEDQRIESVRESVRRSFIQSYQLLLDQRPGEAATLRLTVATTPADVDGEPFGIMQEPLIPLRDMLLQVDWSLAAGVQQVPHLYTHIEHVNQNPGALRAAIDLVILECDNLSEAMNADSEREMWDQEPALRSYNQLLATYQLLRYLEPLYLLYDPTYERWLTLHDL